MHKKIPKQSYGLSPEELWTKTKSGHSDLANLHTRGSPTYVLNTRLQEGQKLTKWAPCSRRVQYLGTSTLHASTVGLFRNLNTKRIIPQFHLVYDDYFETVHIHSDKTPEVWDNCIQFNSFRSDFDDPDYTPDLDKEWLSQQERAQHDDLYKKTAIRTCDYDT